MLCHITSLELSTGEGPKLFSPFCSSILGLLAFVLRDKGPHWPLSSGWTPQGLGWLPWFQAQQPGVAQENFPKTLQATSPLIFWPGCHMPWDLNQSLAKGRQLPKLVQTNRVTHSWGWCWGGALPEECTFTRTGFLLANKKGGEMVLGIQYSVCCIDGAGN